MQKKWEKTVENDPVLEYVNPFIGTGGHGHTYPGASVPFGMVQPSPDNGLSGWDWCSGYHYSDTIIAGFSQLHLTGTGIGDLADILLMPVNKKIDLNIHPKSRDEIPYISSFSHKNEIAQPGYYKVSLENSIDVELSASKRISYHQYTFPEKDTQSVVLDLGFSINWDEPLKTSIEQVDDQLITGYRFSTGWAKNQKVFFAIKFSKPIEKYSFYSDFEPTSAKAVTGKYTSAQFYLDKNGGNTVEVQVAISSVSIKNALENLRTESINFEEAHDQAQEDWQKTLHKIQVSTPIDSLKEIFYSALYHTQLAPVTFSDSNGDFRLENDSIVRNADFIAYSTLSLWDTFRAEQPLLTLMEPERVTDIIKSMLAYYQVNQKLPVWGVTTE